MKRFGLRMAITDETVKKIKDRLLRENRLRNARFRLSVWRQAKQTHVAGIVQKPRPVPKSVRLTVAGLRRPLTRWSHLKSIRYEIFRRARVEAQQRGYEDAVLLNRHGQIVETSVANIFWLKQGKLYTPAVSCGCLTGVMRAQVLRAARSLKMPVHIGAFRLKDLKQADAVFITNAVIGILPVSRIEGRPFKNSQLIVALKQRTSL